MDIDMDTNQLKFLVRRVELGQDCKMCGFRQTCKNVVWGSSWWGDRPLHYPYSLAIVAEAPGENEDIEGTGFVDQSGYMLDRMLEAAGIHKDVVFITHAVKCRPPNSTTPKAREIDACRVNLIAELRQHVSITHILIAGKVAHRSLFGKTKDTLEKNIIYPIEFDGRAYKVMYIYHPFYLLHNLKTTVGSPKHQTMLGLAKLSRDMGYI